MNHVMKDLMYSCRDLFCISRRSVIFPLAVLMLVSCMFTEAATVSNVRASQRAQTQLVDVLYDLSATNSGPFSVSVVVSTNNGATYDLFASSFTGNGFGSAVTLGTRKQIVWNAGVDWPGKYSSAVRFQVAATENGTAGDYMVVDLSAGSSASSYPVSYLTSIPVGGWTDEYKTTKIVFRRIPAGTFTMGSPTNEVGREVYWGGETQHQVTLTQPFYIGVFEVTQKQWERVMGTWPSYFTNTSYRNSRPVETVSYDMIRGASAGTNWPANGNVDADSFMGRMRVRTGKAFDLPTESQWEYAGRAGTTTALNSGKNLTDVNQCPNMSEVGRYLFNQDSWWENDPNYSTNGGTAIVGSYLQNAWGLFDIHGNVNEWCLDYCGPYPGSVTDPKGDATGTGYFYWHPEPCRVIRGGNWGWVAQYCRVGMRVGFNASQVRLDALGDVGFRVALPLGQ